MRLGIKNCYVHSNIITYPKFIATASNDLINDICQKTKSPLCSKILKSDRRARQATSIRVLGEVTLDMAMACTDSTAMLLRSLERTRNHQLREKFENCWVYYAFIYNYLEEAKDSFSSSDFGGVSKNVGAVLKELYSCQQQFQQPPFEAKKLKQENEKLKCLCSVSLVISNHLSGQKQPS
ncbi:UNVERIFIED_CONTAM: hypothetical protein Sradi_2774000 [Sesamum radiatum]|uniref:Pectinesterase inhibitor domain-containing protein n=1 Tax=Sesamum radiatum TaxID=300843 RepID=A0AAW2S8R8_SESRA